MIEILVGVMVMLLLVFVGAFFDLIMGLLLCAWALIVGSVVLYHLGSLVLQAIGAR